MQKFYKNLTFLVALICAACCAPLNASAEVVDYLYDFDKPSDFATEQSLPAGWKADGTYPFVRGTLSYFLGSGSAYSGNYVIGVVGCASSSRNEHVYTEMLHLQGGVEYEFSFMMLAPGGTNATIFYSWLTATVGKGQTPADQTITLGSTPEKTAYTEWTRFSYKFTPETTDDYCFALGVNVPRYNCGAVLLDDIEISGDETGSVDPEYPEHVLMEIPYLETFDNAEHYDGTSYLPIGWTCEGVQPFVTAATDEVAPISGTYYMITDESDVARNERVFTPFFAMKKGVPYTASFYLYMPGRLYNGAWRLNSLDFCVGTEQAADAQTTILKQWNKVSLGEWTKVETTFTPEADGEYCYSFHLTSAVNYTGYVAVDDFTLSAPGSTYRPIPQFSMKTWYNLYTSDPVIFAGQPVQMINLTENGDTYEWVIEGAEPEVSHEENPEFRFPKGGYYIIEFTARNAAGERTTYKEINIEDFSEGSESAALMTYNPSEDKLVSKYNTVPRFATDPTYDFISGPNHYYKKLAERFEILDSQELTITYLSTWLTSFGRMMAYTSEERNLPFTIALYGEKDGTLDPSHVFGKKESCLVDEFGEVGIGLENSCTWGFSLPEPVKVKGNFYVAFEFSDKTPIDSPDPNITRSYSAFGVVEHFSRLTSIYCYPEAGPEGFKPDGKWHSLAEVEPQMAGYGLNLILWCSVAGQNPDGIQFATSGDGQILFAVRVDKDRLMVSGTHAGDTLSLYDLQGKCLMQVPATELGTNLSLAHLPAGIYTIETAAGTQKFVKK